MPAGTASKTTKVRPIFDITFEIVLLFILSRVLYFAADD